MITSIPPRNTHTYTYTHPYEHIIWYIARSVWYMREKERFVEFRVSLFSFLLFLFCCCCCLSLFFSRCSILFALLDSVYKSCIIHYCVHSLRTGTDKSSTKQLKKQRRQQLQQQKTINDEWQAKFIAEDWEKSNNKKNSNNSNSKPKKRENAKKEIMNFFYIFCWANRTATLAVRSYARQ